MTWEPHPRGRASVAAGSGAPAPPERLVTRGRLTGLFDRAASLTFVVAPAGSGKTVLAAEWVQQRAASGRPVHWVSPTDTLELASVLLSSVRPPGDGAQAVPRATDDASLVDLTVDALRARAATGASPTPVVVDDAHLLPAASVALFGRVLSAAPELVRLVLLSRRDLALPLVPLDVAGRLVLIRAGQLGFDDAEAADLVRSHAPRATTADVAQLQAHTRGWAAALILAARTLDAAEDPRTAHLMMRSTEQPVLDYLLSESLDGLSVPTRQVLVSICHETEVTAEAAATLSDRRDAGDRLTALARDGLLVTAYPARHDGGLVWRLHPLLREALRRQAAAARQSTTAAHVRGAALSRATGRPLDALRHAVLSGDEHVLASHVVELAPELIARGHVDLVDDALRHLPPAHRAADAPLLGIEALCRMQTDDIAEAVSLGAAAEVVLGEVAAAGPPGAAATDHRLRADLARLRLWRARMGWTGLEAAITAARAVLEAAESRSLSMARTGATLLELGGAEGWQGDLEAATRHSREALAVARSLEYEQLTVAALGQCALLDAARGATQSSRIQASECLELVAASDPVDGISTRRARLALAWAEFEALELDEAAADLERSSPSAAPMDPLVVALGTVLRARLTIEGGRLQDAERDLAAMSAVPPPLPAFVLALVGTTRAHLAAATGDDVALAEEIDSLLALGCGSEAGLFAAIRTAFEGRVAGAVADLDELAGAPCPNLLTRSAIETVRLALLFLSGDVAAARAVLPHLLTTVAAHRHLHVLTAALRAGDHLLDSLDLEVRRSDAHPYAAEALGAMESYELPYTDRRRPHLDASRSAEPAARQARSRIDVTSPPLLPALTPRESEVLEQLALGGSYSDIGRALFVTENTVKTHLASIYRKLGVERRAEALQVGRARGLLRIGVLEGRRQ